MTMLARRRSSPWPDLQPEILGLVLKRLPALADRVRLRAVCHPWRRNALLEPLPPRFPWSTLLDGTFLGIPEGQIHRMPLPNDARYCHGSVGSWLFLEHRDDGCSLLNPFSKDVVRLPNLDTIWRHMVTNHRNPEYPFVFKLVLLSSSRDVSPDSLFAVLVADNNYNSVISICRSQNATSFRVPDDERISDAAFFDGKLYALSARKFYVLAVDTSYMGKPAVPPMTCIADTVCDSGEVEPRSKPKGYICAYWSYLVESSGRLLHVRRLCGHLYTVPASKRMNIRVLSHFKSLRQTCPRNLLVNGEG
ncbi:hypothetical protein PR202_ga18028 [Eleusine coracana subsp. coracana]|uniref:KIB1-4 beta-propeller domain-containing protein n=1 Tax=Eleusine coracana subsp. coracana TaxID=191504 RepID=A0AAV5CQM4_ELECO|nr:hypothetical protein PR202_ga18028 [Eleusine coracana subsp. coracana]